MGIVYNTSPSGKPHAHAAIQCEPHSVTLNKAQCNGPCSTGCCCELVTRPNSRAQILKNLRSYLHQYYYLTNVQLFCMIWFNGGMVQLSVQWMFLLYRAYTNFHNKFQNFKRANVGSTLAQCCHIHICRLVLLLARTSTLDGHWANIINLMAILPTVANVGPTFAC